MGKDQDASNSLYQALVAKLREVSTRQGTAPTIYVTGHSLGAALACTFSALYMRDHPAANVRTYAFAQPRVGNAAFVKELEALVAKSDVSRVYRRFVNGNDIVNRVPGEAVKYRHEPEEALQGGMETYYLDERYRLYQLPRGYWSERPPFARWTVKYTLLLVLCWCCEALLHCCWLTML